MNIIGCYTLFKKEVLRFQKVILQTILAPVFMALLYQLIFSQVMIGRDDILPGITYSAFLIPGLAMMSMLQNSFANSSSSLVLSRITGNLTFILLLPLSPLSFFSAYVAAAIVRGFLVGLGIILVLAGFGLSFPAHLMWVLIFAFTGCAMMAVLGLLAGIVAETFDRLAGLQNFIIMPLTFLSGVFYSIHGLPVFWAQISHFNPMFYLIDGFRYGFFGYSDISPALSLTISAGVLVALSALALWILKTGWKLRP